MVLDFDKYATKGNELRFSQPVPRIRHITELLDEVRAEDGKLSGYDFGNNVKALRAVKAVFKSLGSFVSPGQLHDLLATLPHEISTFLQDAVPVHSIVSQK